MTQFFQNQRSSSHPSLENQLKSPLEIDQSSISADGKVGTIGRFTGAWGHVPS